MHLKEFLNIQHYLFVNLVKKGFDNVTKAAFS